MATPSAAHVVHLATRFVGSLDPRPPAVADRAWAKRHLTDGEFMLWTAMSNPDQRHSIEVARAVNAAVTGNDARGADDGWPTAEASGFESASQRRSLMIAAALMHDSGKTVSGLGTWTRVVATVLYPVVGRSIVSSWSAAAGMQRRLADYWRHPEIGGRRLDAVGSHPLVSKWAAEHHRPPRSWTVHPALGRVLRDCDND